MKLNEIIIMFSYATERKKIDEKIKNGEIKLSKKNKNVFLYQNQYQINHKIYTKKNRCKLFCFFSFVESFSSQHSAHKPLIGFSKTVRNFQSREKNQF